MPIPPLPEDPSLEDAEHRWDPPRPFELGADMSARAAGHDALAALVERQLDHRAAQRDGFTDVSGSR